ncbi:DUF3422 family protein [Profundibacter sp.]|uniref:DUF3422 family protein n=1 Tax=Profundibacter sp. TaxID=3101071 RepID=UPI003D11442E
MSQLEDHPLRYQMANELHARPFPILSAPCHAVFLALKNPVDAANRDRGLDLAHLIDLLDRFGAPHPQPDATHFFCDLGRHRLKWELHHEFVTYTIFTDGVAERPFDPVAFEVFPADWLATLPGKRLTSALIRVEEMPKTPEQVEAKIKDCFVAESIAVSYTLDRNAIVAGDYRIDSAGHLRFAIFVEPGTGERRIGRTLQRLCEIETYKSMSMLALPKALNLSKRLAQIDVQVSDLVGHIKNAARSEEEALGELLGISTELEDLMAQTSFRFAASRAYSTILEERIAAMREDRFGGRQTFSEFMLRRFDPAMRTVRSAEAHLKEMAERVMRAADLLRTRVEVERSAQNQALLESMDKRADLQLRLQRTVEGLSVVAISYYAINLVTYGLYPFAKAAHLDKPMLTAMATPVVLLVVWWIVRRIRKAH